MFFFHLRLALKSLRKTPWTSLLCVVTIGIGVGVATAMAATYHVFAQNPLPEKSDVLFNVRLDTWDANTQFFGVPETEPPKAITYQDMTGLMRSETPRFQTGVANARAYVFPLNDDVESYQSVLQLCHADFFPMFAVPFQYGSGWTQEMQANKEAVVVVSQKANDKLFGGSNSVGERVRLGARDFTVVGVIDQYNPIPKIYDPVNNLIGDTREFFVPFDFVRDQDLGFSITGNTDGWGDGSTFVGDLRFTAAEWYWIQFWVEVHSNHLPEYEAFVNAYTEEQKSLGRHPRPINNRVQPIMAWVGERNTQATAARGVTIISMLFLAVCSINLVGLLLGKFVARSPLIGVHRALGASRVSVFVQHIVECELIGILGGIVGLLVAIVALGLFQKMLPGGGFVGENLFRVDSYTFASAAILALVSGLLAGIYPAWRACRVAPAVQLKLQ